MPDKEEEINQEIEGFKKKQELGMNDLNASFNAAGQEIQRDALQGLGKLSEEVGGDADKIKEKMRENQKIIAERLGIKMPEKGKGKGR